MDNGARRSQLDEPDRPERDSPRLETFADVLDQPDGVRSQLYVITRYLKRVEHGDLADC